LLLLRERDATKESTIITVLLEKKHPDVVVFTVVDERYSTPRRVSRDERSKHIISFFVWGGVLTKGRETKNS
jgi:hypothetical protein